MKSLIKLISGLAIEFGPIVIFFLLIEFSHVRFIRAVTVFVVATLAALLLAFIFQKRVAAFPLIAGASVIVFGCASIFFHQPSFFIIRDTIYDGVFSVVLFWGLYNGKYYMKPLFENVLAIDDEGWKIISRRWAIAFAILAIGNHLVFIYAHTLIIWVHYKFWSAILTSAFGAFQIFIARKHRLPHSSPWGLKI